MGKSSKISCEVSLRCSSGALEVSVSGDVEDEAVGCSRTRSELDREMVRS
jgi:hypothetical protein